MDNTVLLNTEYTQSYYHRPLIQENGQYSSIKHRIYNHIPTDRRFKRMDSTVLLNTEYTQTVDTREWTLH